MTDIILVRQNKDLQLDNAIKIGVNQSEPIPGTLRYNPTEDRVEAYLSSIQPYNNSNWAPMSYSIASPTELGGIKIGNNLTVTGTGIVSAVADAPSRLYQRVISVCQRPATGNYTSIQQCLTQFFDYEFTGSPTIDWTTSNGVLKTEHTSDPINFPWPDASNLYIIQVSPGVYQEDAATINLPPYVVLQGDTEGSVVLRNNPANGIMLGLSTGSIIENISIDMTNSVLSSQTIGIGCGSTSKDIQIRNVEITTSDLSQTKTGISVFGASNTLIQNCKAVIDLLTTEGDPDMNTLTIIHANDAENLKLIGSDISITGNRNTKTALLLEANTSMQIENSQIYMKELNQDPDLSHINYGIKIIDASVDIKGSQISVLGLDNKDNSGITQICGGIQAIDTGIAPVIIPVGGNTEFIHYNNFDDNDEVVNTNYMWQSQGGLKIGDYLQAIAPSELTPANKGIFQIRGLSESTNNYTIQADNSVSLDDQTIASGVLELQKLYNIGLQGSKITTASQTIQVLGFGSGTGSAFRIQSIYSVLDGQNPELAESHFILTVPQQITVGLQDCDFLSLADACDSIKDASPTKPYEVLMQPGLFIERRLVKIPSFVTVVGQGQGITILQFEQADINNPLYDDVVMGITNTAIVLGDDNYNYYAGLSRLTISIPSGLNNNNILDTAITGIRLTTTGGARLSDITFVMDVQPATPITNTSTIKGISVQPIGTIDTTAKYYFQRIVIRTNIVSQGINVSGFSFTECPYGSLTDCSVSITCGISLVNRMVYGIWSDRSKLDITSPNILVDIDGNAPSGAGYGIISTNTLASSTPPSPPITYSSTPVIIYGGQVKTTGITGDVLYSVFADYESTLFALNVAVQGTASSRNDLLNTYPNSLLKTYKCYYFSVDGTTFINVGDLDNVGNQMGGDGENLNIGDPVGVPDMLGSKNVQVGIRTGTLNQSGNRNTMLGVDVGRAVNTGNNNVLLGYAAGNNIVASNTTLVGAFCGQNITGSSSQEIVMVGTGTGSALTSAEESVIIGAQTARMASSVTGSSIIGSRTATAATALTDTIILGSNTATGLSTTTRDIIIGTNATNFLANSVDNLVVGTNAGQLTSTMQTSVLLGNDTGKNRLTTEESVFIGNGAGIGNFATYLANYGARNIAIGHAAGGNLSSGTDNFITGARAGNKLKNGSFNTIIGSGQTSSTSAASSLTSGSYNFIVGTNTANSLTTGSKNIILGSESGNKLTTQTDTFIIGHNSGGNLTSSTSIIIGNESGKQVSDGGALIIGHSSGINAGGSDLLIIGHNCARGITGARNTIIGNYGAGASNAVVLSGTDNVLIGAYAGYQLTTGNYNVLIGAGNQTNSTGRSLTSGSGNMLFGYQTAPSLSSGSDNLIFGKQSAYNLAGGNRNIFLGANAGSSITSGSENVIIGNEAGQNLEGGTGIVLIGNRAGYSASGSSINDNLFIGNEAGYAITTGSRNTIIGNQAGKNDTIGNYNTYIGNFAGEKLALSYRNICIGYLAGKGIDPVSSKNSKDNIILGSEAGENITEGYQNILIGTKAGNNIKARAKNIMIGPYVGAQANASLNIFIGGTTANAETTGRSLGYWANGNYNIVLGTDAGLELSSAERNIIMGYAAGEKVSSGSKNIILGQMAGNRLTSGDNNILVGQNTGVSISGSIGLQTGNNVIAIGTRAGGNIGSAVNDSILIGTEAGFKNQVDNAICIGPSAGAQNMTGVGGISIGYRAGLSSVAAEGCISIGSNAGAAFTGSTTVGQNISIGDEAGTNNQGTRNIIIGAEAATNASNASNVIVIGYQAGAGLGGLPSSTGVNPDNSIVVGFRAAADGDIGADNIIVGTQAAKSVDNPRVFARNIVIGANAARVSNLAVDSIILGQAGQLGTGGVKNILMGSNAGAVLGNPTPVYPLTAESVLAEAGGANISMNYDQARLFFKEGDMILIETPSVSYQTQIGGIINPAEYANDLSNAALNAITRLVFTQPYPSGAADIQSGAMVRSLANLDTGNVGLVDESKSGGNSLVGESAGGQLTTGSKSVAFGTGALATNQIAKYNNAIGTEAAYNAISDNNTCLGTRAGYSIDLYDGLTYTANSVSFTPNTNTITYGDGFVVDTDEFRFGTVFDVSGSTLNDGRYTVSSANLSAIVVNGIPKYEALGVPLNVSAEDLRVNSATFTFDQVAINGGDAGGIAVGKDPFGIPGSTQSRIYSLAAGTWDGLANTNVFMITGSRYNDGVYYKATDPVESSNSVPIYGQFYPEIFDNQVQITASSINSTDTITNGVSFNDYQVDMPFYAFFGQNKGTYKIGNQLGSQYPTQSKFALARPLNNCALVSSTSIIPSVSEDNIIFTTGYQQEDSITAATLTPNPNVSVGYQNQYSFRKYQIFGQVNIYTGNSTIYFAKAINKLVADLPNANIFCLDCPSANNDKLLFQITDAPDNNTLIYEVIRGTTSAPVNETIIATATSNPMYLTHTMIKNLDRDVSATFSNLGFVKLSSSYNMGMDTHTGDYLIDTVLGNNIILADDQVLPIMASNLGIVQLLPSSLGYDIGISGQVETTMVREYLGMESSYLFDTKISGTDIMIQSGQFNPNDDPAYSYTVDNTAKTITASKDYVFSGLVAPCVIRIVGAYFLVINNDYPFRTLRIDSTQDLSSIAGIGVTHIITYNSISSHSGYTKFDSLIPGTQYEILGGGENNRLIVTPIASPGAITQQSAYVSNSTPMITYNTNKTVLGVYSPTSTLVSNEIRNQITPRGYFKRMYQPATNLSITLNSSNGFYEPLKGYSALNGNLSAVSGDQIVIQPSITLDKYSLNNVGTNTPYEPMSSGLAYTFWDTANSDVFETISLPASNTVTVYGESFNSFKISPSGFLVFEGAANIHTINFQTTNDPAFTINSARADSNVNVKYINDGNSTDGANNVIVINYATNNAGAASNWGNNANNNLELRVYMDNTGNSAGRITLNYSDTAYPLKSNSGLDSNTYVVLGVESTQNTIEKESRYTTNLLNAADSSDTLITCYQPSSAENGNVAIGFTANTYLYSQCTANTTGASPYYFTSSPATNGSNFGAAVDIWGRQMIVGAPGDGVSVAGNAYIYSADGSDYKGYLYSANVVVGATAQFGYSVAIWGDRAVVGAPNNTANGSVHVFDWNGTTWTNTANLGSVIATGLFGHAVDIYDSNTIVVGAPMTSNMPGVTPGSAHIFEYNGANWVEAAYFNDIGDSKGTGSYFGNSVAIWGSNVIVGGPGTPYSGNSYDTGLVSVYQKSGGIWAKTQSLVAAGVGVRVPTPDSFNPYYNFGWQVDINDTYIAIGYPGHHGASATNAGRVYLYYYNGVNWAWTNTIYNAYNTTDYFGYEVSLNDTSLYVSDNIFNIGTVREYTQGTWFNTSEIYTEIGANDKFGAAIASFGNDVVIGSPKYNSYSGLVYVKGVDSVFTPITYGATFTTSATTYNYGKSISANSNSVAIGAPSVYLSGATPNGAVWVYRPSDNIISGWTEDASMPIQPDNLDAYSDTSGFGYSVSLDADWLIAGAPYFNTATTTDSGRVYVYETDNYLSGSYARIDPPNPEASGKFGYSVAQESGKLVIGAPGELTNQGNVYIYNYSALNWVQDAASPITVTGTYGFGSIVKTKNNCICVSSNSSVASIVYLYKDGAWGSTPDILRNSDYSPAGEYGCTMEISDRFVVVGAKSQSPSGAVYIFERQGSAFGQFVSGTTYNETVKLSQPAISSLFGSAVAISDNTLVISDTSGIPPMYYDNFFVYKYNPVFANTTSSWSLIQIVNNTQDSVNSSVKSMVFYNKALLVGWPDYSSSSGTVKAYNLDPLATAKYQLTRDTNTDAYYIQDWQTHTPTSTDLEIVNLGSNIVSIHGQQSNTIAISKWGYLYSDKTQYVSLVEPLNGHYFNSAYWQVDNNILTVTLVDTTTTPDVIVQVNLYTTDSRYANNMEVTYLNLEQLVAGAGTFTGYSGVSHNLYNTIQFNFSTGGIDNSATADIAQTANLATLTFNSPNASVLANIALIENHDIIRIQGMSAAANNGYFTVMSPVANTGLGGDYYMTIRHTGITPTVEEFEVLAANTTINEFRSYAVPTPSSANADIDFMNLYSSYGNTTAFLRFAKCYQSPLSNLTGVTVGNVNVTESSLNYTVATWNNSNIVSNVAVGLYETVPAEYSTGLSLPGDLDNYLVALGTPVPDFSGNVVVEQRNIKTLPTGYIHNYMYRDISTDSSAVQSPSYLFSSNLSKISWGGSGVLGNISINNGNITLSGLNSAGGTSGGLIDLGLGRWDYGFKNVITQPFAGVKPGMLLNISNSGGYSANVMVANTVIGSSGELLRVNCDNRGSFPLSNLSNINAAWDFTTGGEELTIQLINPDPANLSSNSACAQLVSDRYNFAALSNSSTTNQTGSYITKLPLVNYIGEIYGTKYSYMNNYSILNTKRKYETQGIVENNTNIVKVLPYRVPAGTNSKWMIDDLGDRLWIVPRNKIINENPYASVLFFIGQVWINLDILVLTTGGVQTLEVTSGTVNFSTLEPGIIIMVTDNSLFTRYVQIASIISSNKVALNTSYNPNVPIADGTYSNKRIFVNIIGSYAPESINLAYFKPGQRVIVSKTGTSNDRTFTITSGAPTVSECIFIDINLAAVGTRYPEYGVIERAMFGFEAYPLGYSGFGTSSGPVPTANTFTITSGSTSNVLATFKSGDDVDITSGTLNGTFTVTSGQITQPYALILDGMPTGAASSAVSLAKSVAFRVIGKAISTTTDAGVVKFHYTDAQGNNIMIGSFTGQFAGATGLSIHNLFLGNKVGQTNQGSGNVFFGSETGFATDASQGATTYDNKLAIYKNNFIGVPSDPLIGGDFASGRVGVGTIDPDGKLLATLGDRTLMVVDGKVRAQAFNTFTGTHFVILNLDTEPVKPELGMILCSRGRVHKLGLLDNITECQLSTRAQDKRVYGVYAGDEMIEGRQIAHCASVGEGSILVCTLGGEPENGDYLCSSPIAGLAQLQPDDLLHNYTVAKLIESVNWSAVSRYISYEGHEYKVALVACSYHCA